MEIQDELNNAERFFFDQQKCVMAKKKVQSQKDISLNELRNGN